MKKIAAITALAGLALLVIAWVYMWPPICLPERSNRTAAACVNELRIIDAAKEQVALANRLTNGADVSADDVEKYFRHPRACPDGGVYTYNRIGVLPTCSLDGQVIPERPPPRKIRTTFLRWRSEMYNWRRHVHVGRLDYTNAPYFDGRTGQVADSTL